MSNDINKLPQKNPNDLFKPELPPPKLEKIELPKPKQVRVDVGFWDTVWLLIKSVVRNKARDAMEGERIRIADFGLRNVSWFAPVWKIAVGLLAVGAVVWFAIKLL